MVERAPLKRQACSKHPCDHRTPGDSKRHAARVVRALKEACSTSLSHEGKGALQKERERPT